MDWIKPGRVKLSCVRSGWRKYGVGGVRWSGVGSCAPLVGGSKGETTATAAAVVVAAAAAVVVAAAVGRDG